MIKTPSPAEMIKAMIASGTYSPRRCANPDTTAYMCKAILRANRENPVWPQSTIEETFLQINHVLGPYSSFMVSTVWRALDKTYGCTNTITRKSPAMYDGLLALYGDWERIHSDPSKILRYFTPYVYTG